jgi:hypothetical protein
VSEVIPSIVAADVDPGRFTSTMPIAGFTIALDLSGSPETDIIPKEDFL